MQRIIEETFDNIEHETENISGFECAIKSAAHQLGYETDSLLIDYVLKLKSILQNRQSVIITGHPGIGKTTVWKVLLFCLFLSY